MSEESKAREVAAVLTERTCERCQFRFPVLKPIPDRPDSERRHCLLCGHPEGPRLHEEVQGVESCEWFAAYGDPGAGGPLAPPVKYLGDR
jgi:hypothetical protein